MKKEIKTYVVYVLTFRTNNDVFYYVGSGDKQEPNRRVYDFLRGRVNTTTESARLALNLQTGNHWGIEKKVIVETDTKRGGTVLEQATIDAYQKCAPGHVLNIKKAARDFTKKEMLFYLFFNEYMEDKLSEEEINKELENCPDDIVDEDEVDKDVQDLIDELEDDGVWTA